MLVKVMPSNVPVFVPVTVHALTALGPVIVSLLEPPVIFVILEKDVAPVAPVGFSVPALELLIVQALTTLGPAIVLVPLLPSIPMPPIPAI